MAELGNKIYGKDFDKIDLRKNPEEYRVGRGEEGVLLYSPWSEIIGKHWAFKTPEIAKDSSDTIYAMFLQYGKQDNFPAQDMARKYLQMGMTRSLRYYHHKSGHKYVGAVPADKKGQSGAHGRKVAPMDLDYEKKKSADIFQKRYKQAMANKEYIRKMEEWKDKYG